MDLKGSSLGARPPLPPDQAKSHDLPALKDPYFLGMPGSKQSTPTLFSVDPSSNLRTGLEKIAVVNHANAAVRESAEVLGLYSSEMRGARGAWGG
jgi:hypothetical protein